MSQNRDEILRPPLSSDLEEIRPDLVRLVPALEAEPDWYGSVYLQKKVARVASADLKKTDVSEDSTRGVVLRIFDGKTLFESATDHLSQENLRTKVEELVSRVKKAKNSSGDSKVYLPPNWDQRLGAQLDPEILIQIPKNVGAETPVHFGSALLKDPVALGFQEILERLTGILEKCKLKAPEYGLDPNDISFAKARQSLAIEESIFIDRESNLSQTLYRISLALFLMSGPHRVYTHIGGIGGLEMVEITDGRIGELLRDLKSLKSADTLKPGKYRVLFSPPLAGVLAHEAFGHSQEGDTCARGRSKAWELYQSGESVGNEHATILNNPAIYQNGVEPGAAWGSYFFDEEGWLAQEQVLLERGKLKAPMTNLTSAIRLGVPRTANGKRENWSHGIYTRQTNTYFLPGTQTLNDLIEQIEDGFLATHAAGGMEDPKGMGIQVGISYLREVKNGKLTGKVFRGPSGGDIQMTGYTPDILNSIIGKSKIEYDKKEPDKVEHPYNDVGGCGKYHKEFVHAGCGGPYLLLDNVTLG